MRIQCFAIACVVAAFVLIFAAYGLGREGVNELYAGHKGLGVAMVVMALLQLIIGSLRPLLKHPKRSLWRMVHYSWGWITLLGGKCRERHLGRGV
jgi:hypothetical protein